MDTGPYTIIPQETTIQALDIVPIVWEQHYINSTGLGYNADNTASNSVVVGNTSVNSIGGQVGWTTLSDGRFKKNIRNDEVKGLEFITGLQPVTYNYDVRAKESWMEENYGERGRCRVGRKV